MKDMAPRPSGSMQSIVFIALGHLVIELCSNSLPVIYPILIETLGLTYSQVGTLALVSSVGTSLAQPFFGYLGDLWSPRRMSALSVAWIGIMLGLAGLVRHYALLALVVGLGALGSAAFHPPGAIIASSGGGTKRGAAVSIFSVGGTLGSALSPLLMTAGIAWLGTSSTLLLIPLALLFSVVLGWQLARVTPAKAVGHTGRSGAVSRQNPAGLVLIVLAVMCLAWLQISLRTYLLIWLQSQGRSLAASGQMMFVFLAAGGVGSLLGGRLSDRIGRWQLLLVCLVILAPVVWLFVGASGASQWALVFTVGMLVGATFPVSIVLAQESWPGGVGIASGLVMGLGWLPGGIGASLTGQIADRLSLEVGLRWLVAPVVLGTLFVIAFALQSRSGSRAHSPAQIAVSPLDRDRPKPG
ncbi:MAG: MFS transporter [Anaerolineae bacterium]|nr:MFS transporter [Anaerolineae bacterium]